jgi:hypothetical protein
VRDFELLRQRYLKDPTPVRLGGLAANLARIKSFSKTQANGPAVESLVEESKYFIEWAAPEIRLEIQQELVELQLMLARWQRAWDRLWPLADRRAQMADEAKAWSEKILKWSGLVGE